MDDDRESADAPTTPQDRAQPRRFDAAAPDEVANLEATFGIDIDGDGAIGGTAPSGVNVREAHPEAAPTPRPAPTPETGGDPFVDTGGGARRWWPLVIGLALGAAAAGYFFA